VPLRPVVPRLPGRQEPASRGEPAAGPSRTA
jgi:hypothetical protein